MARTTTTTTNPFRRIASVVAILLALLVSAPVLADTGAYDVAPAPTGIGFAPAGVEWTKVPTRGTTLEISGVEWTVVTGN